MRDLWPQKVLSVRGGIPQSLTAPMEVVHLRDQRINKYIKPHLQIGHNIAEAGTGFAAGL